MTAKRYSNLDVWKMGAENTAKLLNELHEQIHFLNMKYAERTSIIGEQSLKIENLEKENEQLKTELKAIHEERHKEFIIGNGW